MQFQQPSSSAVAFNRVRDQNPSQIFGSIEANGKVVLVNPNGLVFGPSAQINVGSLVASSLEVVGFDATSGRFTFGGGSGQAGAVINQGHMAAAPGGSITLLGGQVSNSGSIIADFGTVNLAAGRTATIDLAGDGLLRLEVDAELVTHAGGAAAAVDNAGNIQANGGRVLLTAQALDGVFANLINNDGTVRANRIDDSGGTIRLVGAGGTVRSSGTLDASAGDALSDGGRVEVLGERVGLFGDALVDVSGARDGGTALLGGDYQGKNPQVLNAARTYVGADARIVADAGVQGHGGRVIVWADEVTRFDGHLSARGGASGGDGGFAEISGGQSLILTGTANLGAAHGARGTLLLDPENITIDNSAVAPPPAEDGTYAFEDDPGADARIGNQTIERLLENGNVVLQANNDIIQNADAHIDVSGRENAAGRALTLEARNDITLNGNITLRDGALTLDAGRDIALAGVVATNGGVTLDAGGAITGGSRISGETLTITGASIGSDAAPLNTNVEVLSATASTGGIYITEQDGLRLQNLQANAGDVRITSTTGDIVVGEIDATNVALDASAGAILDDGNDATRIVADNASLSAVALGTASRALDTDVTTLEATASSGGIFVRERDDLNLTASASGGALSVQTLDGSLTISEAIGNGMTLTAGGTDNSLIVNGVVNAGSGNASLTAGGAITAGGGSQIIGDTLSIDAASIGTSGERLSTDVASLHATATNGGVYVTEANALTVTAFATGGPVDVRTTNGTLTVDGVSGDGVTLAAGGAASGMVLNGNVDAHADGTVSLTAGTHTNRGAIIAGAGHHISGGSLVAIGSTVGTAAARLNTSVTELDATSHGGIFVTETDVLNLTANATNGVVDVRTVDGALTVKQATGSAVVLTAGGAGRGITLQGEVNAGAGDVTLRAGTAASGGEIMGAAGHLISGSSLTAAGATIGTSNARLATNIETLSAVASAGDVYVSERDGLMLADVNAAFNVDVISTAGDLVVSTLAASERVTLTAASGAIVDDGDDSTRLSANDLILSARSIGAPSILSGQSLDSSARLDTHVATLTAVATAGGIFIDEADGLQQVNVQATGGDAGDIELLTRSGDLHLEHVSASDTVLLAAGRNIFTVPGAAAVTARSVELRAGTTNITGGQMGTPTDPIDLQLNEGRSLRLFVPYTEGVNDSSRTASIRPSVGAITTSRIFDPQDELAARAGFNQLQGLGDLELTSDREAQVRVLQGQTTLTQGGISIDWASYDVEASSHDPLWSVCSLNAQEDDESDTSGC